MNPKEPEFAKTRRCLQAEILAFMESYSREAGVNQIRHGCRLAGTAHPRTLIGHDLALDWCFQDPQEPTHAEEVGIRIRHENWDPKVTVWSTHSMMESFRGDHLTDEIKNKLMDCVDKTITQS